MCTFDLTFDDTLVSAARRSFPNEDRLKEWMQDQLSILLQRVSTEAVTRTPHKHDALMGILSDAPEIDDCKRIHLREKYNV